jgi:hypothetical protein
LAPTRGQHAAPPVPQQTVGSVTADAEEIKERGTPMTPERPTDDKGGQAAATPARTGQPHPAAAAGETIPSYQQALAEDTGRTRQQLGDPVEALAAKVDVGAQAPGKAAEMKTRVAGAAGTAADRVTAKAADLRHQLPGKTSGLTKAVAAGGAKARQITPASAQQAAARGARTVRERPGEYAAAVVMLLIGWWLGRMGRP